MKRTGAPGSPTLTRGVPGADTCSPARFCSSREPFRRCDAPPLRAVMITAADRDRVVAGRGGRAARQPAGVTTVRAGVGAAGAATFG
ncbi:hypothetical protein GCM10027258_83010 [Amycolatopsis stemonae]